MEGKIMKTHYLVAIAAFAVTWVAVPSWAGPGSAAGPVHGRIDDLEDRVTYIEQGGPFQSDFSIQGNLQVGGNLTITGEIVSDTPVIHYLTIGQSAFQPTEDSSYQLDFFGTGAFSLGTVVLTAPVQLPDNARLRSMSCFFYDGDAENDLSCSIAKNQLSDGAFEYIATVSSESSEGHVTKTVSLDETIVNYENGYFIRVTPAQGSTWGLDPNTGPRLGIKGVRIRYEVGGTPVLSDVE
jgi:hypothetical protein